MAGEEVGVEVGVDDAHDAQPVSLGVIEVLSDVTPGVDHDGLSGCFITNEIGRL